MTHETILTELIEKLHRNRELVPLRELKTVYSDAYSELRTDIWKEIRHICVQLPECLDGISIEDEYANGLISIFESLKLKGRYESRLTQAAYRDMDPDKVIQIAHELRDAFYDAAEVYVMNQTSIYAEGACFDPENPQAPKIYNALLRQFWDEQIHGWRDPKDGELGASVLIFSESRACGKLGINREA